MSNTRSLNQILCDLGYTTQKTQNKKGFYKMGAKDILKNGQIDFTGDCFEVTDWLRKTGQI